MRIASLLLGLAAVVGITAFTGSTGVEPEPLPPDPLHPKSPRDRVVAAALSQVGNTDPAEYWADVLPGVNVGHADWCGAGALWCLHQAGLALDRHWVIGKGFLLTPPALPTTHAPQIGDIAYFDHNQHQAVVTAVADDGHAVELVNFNGQNGAVSVSTVTPAQVTAFFSIAPLLPAASV